MATLKAKKPPDHSVEIVKMTPDWALELLDGHDNYRNLSPKKVEQFVGDMKEGRWVFDGEPIRLDKDGHLVDGQHRLNACVHADYSFETCLVQGIETEAVKVIDTGKPRNFADYLRSNGIGDATAVSAAVTAAWRIDQPGEFTHQAGTVSEYAEWYHQNPDIVWAVTIARKLRRSHLYVRAGLAGAVFYQALKLGWPKEYMEAFVADSASDMPTDTSSATWAFHRYFTKAALDRKGAMEPRVYVALVMKALRAYLKGEQVFQLRWRRVGPGRESFPKMPVPNELDRESFPEGVE